MLEWKAEIRRRLQNLKLEPTREAEIIEELVQHLIDRYAELRAGGATETDAAREALAELGESELLRQELRRIERLVNHEPVVWGARRQNMIGDLWQDLRYGWRMMRKHPGFTLVAVFTLALGIGANTAIFSVVDAVVLKPLPYTDPDRLLMVWEKPPGVPRNSVSAANFLDWKRQNKVFAQISATSARSFNLQGLEVPERIPGRMVSANYFDLLGVKPAFGRTFLPEEEQAEKNKVVVITHRLWRSRFSADPSAIGRSVTLDGAQYTIIGVLKPESNFDRDTQQIFAPLSFANPSDRRSHFLSVLARLQPEVTIEQAQAAMNNIAAGLSEQYPNTNKGWGVQVDRLQDLIVTSGLRQTLLVLFGAVVFILLIACANLANLMMVRAASRVKEFSIRAALGANPFHLVRQLLTESMLLSLVGGALGVVLGYWLVQAFMALVPASIIPAEAQITLDRRVLLFTLAISLLTGLAFGLIPAWRAAKTDLNETLKEGGKSSGAGPRYLSRLLIIGEVSLALALLIGSGLLVRSFLRLEQTELGIKPDNVLTLRLPLLPNKYQSPDQILSFYRQALERVRSLPGVKQASLVTDLPLVGWSFGLSFYIEGRESGTDVRPPAAHLQVISPSYFQTLSIPIIKGRAFTEQDQATSQRVVIINETLARTYFKDQDPLGKYLVTNDSNQNVRLEIVGIAGNVRVYGLGNNVPAENTELYLPYAQTAQSNLWLAVQTAGAPLAMAGAVQAEIRTLDKEQPITSVRAMEEIIARTLADERFNTILLGLFAAIAVALSALGIYGVISYTVAQHTREIGIRMALGAQRSHVLRLMLGQGMVLVGIGVVIGLGAAFALTRVMEGMLYGISKTDPVTFVITPLVLTVVALLACYLPARRATRVDPMVALRHE